MRRAVTRESFEWFFAVYFAHYLAYETAAFQREMIRLLEDGTSQMLVFVAFRGSGKSTIVTMAYVLWSILGRQGKRYAVLAGQTQRQARQLLQNIRQELDGNPLLRGDLGPFREEQDEWGSLSLVVSNYGAKIAAVSSEQSVRGMRHGPHRPDLIIADDVEDLASVQTLEGRDKTYGWFTGDLVPAGDRGTRVVVVGNLLHEDSLVMRLRSGIERGDLAGTFRKYPLIDEAGACLWTGKFPDAASLEAERRKIGSRRAWLREYLLAVVPQEDQVVPPEWIQHYDALPAAGDPAYRYTIASVDLAISSRDTADYTAIVTAKVYGRGDDLRIYVMPHPFNRRVRFVEVVETVKALRREHGSGARIVIESNGFQEAVVDQLRLREGCPVEGVKVHGPDKRTRLSLVTTRLRSGAVLFPRSGAEHLIRQIVGFGVERHDDLTDALTMLVNCVMETRGGQGFDVKKFLELNPHLRYRDPNSIMNMKF